MTEPVALPRRIVIGLLRGYKKYVSPLLPPACRYEPTCSVYMSEAVEFHGVIRGGWLGLRRLLRCHPFTKGGFDPVPIHTSSASSGPEKVDETHRGMTR